MLIIFKDWVFSIQATKIHIILICASYFFIKNLMKTLFAQYFIVIFFRIQDLDSF